MTSSPPKITPTSRDLQVLPLLAEYTILSRGQLQVLGVYPSDRVARRGLARLCETQLIHPVRDRQGPHGRAFMLTKRGCEVIAAECAGDRLLYKPIRLKRPDHQEHYLAVSATHICFRQAIGHHPDIELLRWIGEDEVVNPQAPKLQHYRLRTDFQEPQRTRCDPDAAILFRFKEHRVVVYLEQDRGTAVSGTSPRLIASRKLPGYRIVKQKRLHRLRHFADATYERFLVLSISPTENRRDQLRRAFRGKPDAVDWRFASMTDISPCTVLTEPVLFKADDGTPTYLFKTTTETEAPVESSKVSSLVVED